MSRVSIPLLLFLATLLFYAPSARFGFLYDDNELIVYPEAPESVGQLLSVFAERHWHNLPYYRPVSRLTMVAQKWIHGDEPAPFHLFNAFLMGCIAALAWAVLRLDAFRVSRPVAAAAAAALVTHPIASSCVYPISSGRETSIPALLILACVYVFLRGGRGWMAGSIALFALALLAKEQAVVVPALLLGADLLRLSPQPPGRDLAMWMKRHLPFLGVLLVYFVARWKILGALIGGEPLELVRDPSAPFLSILYSLQTIALPFIRLHYEPRLPIWFSYWRGGLTLLLLGGLAAWTWRSAMERRRRLLLLSAWFLLTLLPTANVLHQEARFAERYVLLPLFALIAGLAVLVSHRGPRGALARSAVVVCGIAYASVSLARGQYFESELVFLQRWTVADPKDAQPHLSLGHRYERRGEHAASIPHFEEAIRRNPANPLTRNKLAAALLREGTRRIRSGEVEEGERQIEEALGHYRAAIRLDPADARAHARLGAALLSRGMRRDDPTDLSEAAAVLQRGLVLDPSDARTANNLGAAKAGLSSARDADPELLRQAMDHFSHALRLRPDYPEAHKNLGNLLVTSGRPAEAVPHYREAVRLQPDDAGGLSALCALLAGEGEAEAEVEEGLARCREALRLDPQSHATRSRLAWIYATAGRAEHRDGKQAVRLAEEAARGTRYEQPAVLQSLAAAYAETGRFEEAVSTARRAIELAARQGREALALRLEAQLERYRSGRPQRGPPAVGSDQKSVSAN